MDRCVVCRVFVPVEELLFSPGGSRHCAPCGPPRFEEAVDAARAGTTARWRTRASGLVRSPARLVAVLVGLTVLGFFLAACVSQL